MMRFAAFSAACLMLAAPALASTGEPTGVSLQGPPITPLGAPFGQAPAVAQDAPPAARLRSVEPGTTGSVQPAPEAVAKPSCPPERRVGTGAGFCMIN